MTLNVNVIIPARKGSEGLPGKNMQWLIDRPLTMHSIDFAKSITSNERILVTTDDPDLLTLSRSSGVFVPEKRPRHLATSRTPMADVVRYALQLFSKSNARPSPLVVLLDPTSPLRKPEWIVHAVAMLERNPESVGIVSVSRPSFNPEWVGVTLDSDDKLSRHPISQETFTRRQDVRPYWRINGGFYVWRWDFASRLKTNWLDQGAHMGFETPELMSHSIDTDEDLQLVKDLLSCQIVSVPWMKEKR